MSIITFEGNTAAQLYEEGLSRFRVSGRKERTRNGPALVLPDITAFTLTNPQCRVLDDRTRNANPFFHMMEFIWMMAARDDAKWLMQFNKRMGDFADEGVLEAAYGERWRRRFGSDQIREVINLLRIDPTSRQAVIQMWYPSKDLIYGKYKDKACNTEIIFRNNCGALDMLVVNRSNDFIWGALGANIVHMTMLHELVAHFSGIPLGKYTVVSNNLHMYTDRPDFEPAMKQIAVEEIYDHVKPMDMFDTSDTYEGFVKDCEKLCAPHDDMLSYNTEFVRETAHYVYAAWVDRTHAQIHMKDIQHPDWRLACQNYLKRKTLSSATSTEP